VLSKRNDVLFICVGDGNIKYLEDLQQYSEDLGVSENIRWQPGQVDIENTYNALDVLVSTSAFGEGFSNTLAEAMSCGIRCVATDVGDAEKILFDTGFVVPPGNSSAVADGILEILDGDERENSKFKKSAIDHIRKNYSIDQLISNTLNVFKNRIYIGYVPEKQCDKKSPSCIFYHHLHINIGFGFFGETKYYKR
jgi:glycosyltransferase involved in cell wall biosynthesis